MKSGNQFQQSPKKPIKVRIFDMPNLSLKSSQNFSRALPSINQTSSPKIIIGSGGCNSTLLANAIMNSTPNLQSEEQYPRRLGSQVYKSVFQSENQNEESNFRGYERDQKILLQQDSKVVVSKTVYGSLTGKIQTEILPEIDQKHYMDSNKLISSKKSRD